MVHARRAVPLQRHRFLYRSDSFIIGTAKFAFDKNGGTKAKKHWTLKSGRLQPSSLLEVYAYGSVRVKEPLGELTCRRRHNKRMILYTMYTLSQKDLKIFGFLQFLVQTLLRK